MVQNNRHPYPLLGVIFIVALTAGGIFLAVEHFDTLHAVGGAFWRSLATGSLWEDALSTGTRLYALIRPYLPPLIMLYAMMTAGVIFLEHQNPDRTIAWIMALVFFPVVGILLYLYLGSTFSRKRTFRHLPSPEKRTAEAAKTLQRFCDSQLCSGLLPPAPRRLIPMLQQNSGARLTLRNQIDVLTNGEATFGALLHALNEAHHSIHLEYFSIADDILGNAVHEALVSRARAGVAVRVLYDAVGSWNMGRPFLQGLREAGVQTVPFSPVALPMLRRDFNFRNHRKIAVVDGAVGFLGGLNIGDMYMGKSALGFWRDTHLRVQGEGVRDLQEIFLRDWTFASGQKIPETGLFPPVAAFLPVTPLQIVPSGPDSEWSAVQQGYFTLAASAQQRLWISTPYLVPDDAILAALSTAALGGVDVRLIIPSYPDHPMVFWASRSFLDGLLRSGARVYLYRKGFIHAKIMLVDDTAASVGSTNLDLRSLTINFEVQAFLYDAGVVRRLEHDFLNDFADAVEITLEERLGRPFWERAREAGARLLSSQL